MELLWLRRHSKEGSGKETISMDYNLRIAFDLAYRDQDREVGDRCDPLISSLRQLYGLDFAPEMPGNFRLSDVVHALDARSLARVAANPSHDTRWR